MTPLKRPISIADLYQMKWATDPQISPAGDLIAFVLKTVDDQDQMKYQNHIWMVPTDGSRPPYQFTNVGKSETNPRWSPDGKTLAFTALNEQYIQIWTVPVNGGAPLPLTANTFNTGSPLWSPDGSKIAYTAKISDSDSATPTTDVKVITTMQYKLNGVGFLDGKVSQIFLTSVDSGQTQQLTSGVWACVAPAWSPCSQYIAFSSNRTEDWEYTKISDIWMVNIENLELNKITNSDGVANLPAWSPNGQYIAYSGHKMAYSVATIPTITLKSLTDHTEIDLLPNFDTAPHHQVAGDSVASIPVGSIWDKASQRVYFQASWHGKTHIYTVSINDHSTLRQLTHGDEVLYGISYCAKQNTFAALKSSFTKICDLDFIDASGNRRQLTHLNDALLNEVALSLPEQFTFTHEGFENEGWIMKPYGYREGEKYPTIMEIHGGPHGAYGHIFFHEFQVLAAAGYAVVFTNPPGSSNYGQEYLNQTHHDYGGLGYRAIMAAADYVNQTYDFVDPERWGVTGGSYGGYMVNWIITQSDFFKAAVSFRSSSNRYNLFGTSDLGFNSGRFENKGNPWDHPDFWMRISPISHVNNVNTPLMLVHGEQDLRCPIAGAEEFYTALRWLRKEVVFVRFPDENHELSRSGKPKHRIERLNYLVDWFTSHIVIRSNQYH